MNSLESAIKYVLPNVKIFIIGGYCAKEEYWTKIYNLQKNSNNKIFKIYKGSINMGKAYYVNKMINYLIKQNYNFDYILTCDSDIIFINDIIHNDNLNNDNINNDTININIIDNMRHDNTNDIANMNDFEDMNIITTTLTNSLHNFESQLSNTTNTNELKQFSNKLKQYDHLDLEIPKVTFKTTNLNEIKTLNKFDKFNTISNISNLSNLSNSNSVNSARTASETSYTQNINRANNLYISKPNKNIRITKSQKKSSEIDEVDHVYNKLQDYVRYMTIDRKNYSIVICKAIEIIENYKDARTNISNIKKDIITKALNRLIKLDLVLNNFDKNLFITTISNIIDLLVTSTKHNLNEKEKEKEKEKHKVKDKSLTNTRDDIVLARSGQISYSLVDKLTTIVIKKHYGIDKILVNIGTLTNILMILVDKYTYLSGIEKKMIVLQVINTFIKDRIQYIIDITEDKKEELILILDTVPLTIDLFITLQKGKYKINIQNDIFYTNKGKTSIFECFKLHSKKNMIWSEFIDATEGMTDFILVNGEIVYQLTYVYSDKQ